jgi:hypothetical protein
VRATIFGEVPYTDISTTITTDDFPLVRVNNNIRDGRAMSITALNSATASLPDLDGTILRTSDHPFALTVKCDTSNIARMSFESKNRVWVGGLNVVELHVVVTTSRKETLVGGDT